MPQGRGGTTNLQLRIADEKLKSAKEELTPVQQEFALWLSLPEAYRVPKSQEQWAKEHNMSDVTCWYWKKLPAIWEVRDSYLTVKGKELATKAVYKIETLLDSENSKVALDAAKDILSRWGEPAKHATVLTSLRDIFETKELRTKATVEPKEELKDTVEELAVEGEFKELNQET